MDPAAKLPDIVIPGTDANSNVFYHSRYLRAMIGPLFEIVAVVPKPTAIRPVGCSASDQPPEPSLAWSTRFNAISFLIPSMSHQLPPPPIPHRVGHGICPRH